MFISRLKLQNWRNFRDVDAALQPRTFIIGPNASGKSNLLDAVRFLRDAANDGLQTALRQRGEISKVRSLAGRRTPGLSIEIELSGADMRPAWRYRLAIRREPAGRHRTLITEEQVWDGSGKLILNRPTESDQGDPALLTQTALEQVFANRAFREFAGFLQTVDYLHLVPQMIRSSDETSSGAGTVDPFGRGFLERIAAAPKKQQESRLRKIGAQLHRVLPQFEEGLTIERDAGGRPHLEARFSHWRPIAARQQEDQFSDGTLRLIGLLWSLMEGSGPLLLEEPELSLQADVVEHLAGMFARAANSRSRQILVTTHSWDILKDEGISPEEILTIKPTSEGSIVCSGIDDESAVAVSQAGGAAGSVLLGAAVQSGGAQLPLRL